MIKLSEEYQAEISRLAYGLYITSQMIPTEADITLMRQYAAGIVGLLDEGSQTKA